MRKQPTSYDAMAVLDEAFAYFNAEKQPDTFVPQGTVAVLDEMYGYYILKKETPLQ